MCIKTPVFSTWSVVIVCSPVVGELNFRSFLIKDTWKVNFESRLLRNAFILYSDLLKAWLHIELYVENALFQNFKELSSSSQFCYWEVLWQSFYEPSHISHFSKKSRSISLFLTSGYVVLPWSECFLSHLVKCFSDFSF